MKRQTSTFKWMLVIGILCLITFVVTAIIYFMDNYQSVYLYGLAGSGFMSIVLSFVVGITYTGKPTDEDHETEMEYISLLHLKLPKVLSMISQLVNQMISYTAAETETGNYIFDYYGANKDAGVTICSQLFWERYFPLIVNELQTRPEIQSITIKPNYTVDIILYTKYVDDTSLIKFPPNLGKILLVGDNIYANVSSIIANTTITPEMLGITENEIEYCKGIKNGTVKNYNKKCESFYSLEGNTTIE